MCGMDSSGLRYGQMMSPCKHCNVPLCFIKGEEFFGIAYNSQHLTSLSPVAIVFISPTRDLDTVFLQKIKIFPENHKRK
jgi:hypothetical protein